MQKLFSHQKENFKTNELPILTKLNAVYKLWHGYLIHLPRHTRFTLGTRIDNYFTDCLELSLFASYSSMTHKTALVKKLSAKLDCLKFFLKVAWELKALDHKKYIAVSTQLAEVGKMTGGWLRLLNK
ncbi:four helix bundle protein [Patescibacteria group bacterium]